MDTNNLKIDGKIVDTLNVENKSQKNKKKIKAKNSKIEDNSKQVTIGEQTINNTNLAITLSDVQVNQVLGIAQNEIFTEFKEKLKNYSKEHLDKAAKDIAPLFLGAFLNQDLLNEQEVIFTDLSADESIKKQAIQKLSFLTKKDIDLLILLDNMLDLSVYLSCNFSANYFDQMVTIKQDQQNPATIHDVKKSIVNKVFSLKLQISKFEMKYEKIKYSIFENLLNNNIIINDGNIHKPLLEFFCKLFIDFLDDKTKNAEYYEDPERSTKNRESWTRFYTLKKYESNIELTNLWHEIEKITNHFPSNIIYGSDDLKGKFYWKLTSIGKYITSKIKNK